MAFLVILAVLVFIVLVLVSRIRIVPQANVYVVERLGAFYKAWGTGIHFLVPFIAVSYTHLTLPTKLEV